MLSSCECLCVWRFFLLFTFVGFRASSMHTFLYYIPPSFCFSARVYVWNLSKYLLLVRGKTRYTLICAVCGVLRERGYVGTAHVHVHATTHTADDSPRALTTMYNTHTERETEKNKFFLTVSCVAALYSSTRRGKAAGKIATTTICVCQCIGIFVCFPFFLLLALASPKCVCGWCCVGSVDAANVFFGALWLPPLFSFLINCPSTWRTDHKNCK